MALGQSQPIRCCDGARRSGDQARGLSASPSGAVLMPSRIQCLRASAFKRQAGLCCYCGAPMWLRSPDELVLRPPSSRAARHLRCTAEHLLAKRAGGKDTSVNVAAACWRCNSTRHKRQSPLEPSAYREQVRRRMAAGRWHDQWVHLPAPSMRRTPACNDQGASLEQATRSWSCGRAVGHEQQR